MHSHFHSCHLIAVHKLTDLYIWASSNMVLNFTVVNLSICNKWHCQWFWKLCTVVVHVGTAYNKNISLIFVRSWDSAIIAFRPYLNLCSLHQHLHLLCVKNVFKWACSKLKQQELNQFLLHQLRTLDLSY